MIEDETNNLKDDQPLERFLVVTPLIVVHVVVGLLTSLASCPSPIFVLECYAFFSEIEPFYLLYGICEHNYIYGVTMIRLSFL